MAAVEHQEEELLDYEEDEVEAGGEAGAKADGQKKGYVGIHSTSFKDFLLKVRGQRACLFCYFSLVGLWLGGGGQRVRVW
jgi:hypothetical protein